MPKPPHNEHELELALSRFAGSSLGAIEWRNTMAGVILSQMLPAGCVVKGGASIRIRLGPANSRVTVDFDAARSIALEDFLAILRSKLESGWSGFSGTVKVQKQRTPQGVPHEYAMQPLDVKLAYRNHPWCTVRLELGYNELGDADEMEIRELPESVKSAFAALHLPIPAAAPLMALPFQIAQKLHGLSQSGSVRVRDMIDLQLIAACEDIDYKRTAEICRRLFAYRKMQLWPPVVAKGPGWDELYKSQIFRLPVLADCDSAVHWTNNFIAKIDNS